MCVCEFLFMDYICIIGRKKRKTTDPWFTEELDESFEGMEQSDLGGCCCDCCHKTRGGRDARGGTRSLD